MTLAGENYKTLEIRLSECGLFTTVHMWTGLGMIHRRFSLILTELHGLHEQKYLSEYSMPLSTRV
jgi:hypothetical protein